MRRSIAGGVLFAAVAVAALAAVGTAGATGDAGTVASLASTIDTTRMQLGRLAAVQFASRHINLIRAVGGLAGVGVGIGIGSVATYHFGWRQ